VNGHSQSPETGKVKELAERVPSGVIEIELSCGVKVRVGAPMPQPAADLLRAPILLQTPFNEGPQWWSHLPGPAVARFLAVLCL